jgi:uncharacterized membrane protein YfcA
VTDASPWSYLLLAIVGFVASVLNIVPAGGSFLTLPVPILLGRRLRGATLGLVTRPR